MASLARWYGGGFGEVDRLTLTELSFWHWAAEQADERDKDG